MKIFLVCLFALFACESGTVSTQQREVTNDKPTPAATATGGQNGSPVTKVGKNMTEEQNLSALSLTATAEKTQDALVISYQVQNNTDQPLYLWDRMIDYHGSEQVISRDLAYVFFEEPRTLDVIRANLKLPELVDVATKETPYVRLVPGRGRADGQITLKIPVAEFSPYYGFAQPDNSDQHEISQVRLMIGWTDFRTGMVIEEAVVGGEKVLLIKGSWPQPYQQVLERRLDIKVPVLVAKENFERTMPLR